MIVIGGLGWGFAILYVVVSTIVGAIFHKADKPVQPTIRHETD